MTPRRVRFRRLQIVEHSGANPAMLVFPSNVKDKRSAPDVSAGGFQQSSIGGWQFVDDSLPSAILHVEANSGENSNLGDRLSGCKIISH